ncbi:MAG: hypothetical protein JWQ71_3056 [Pedosphaera sp.]|nr:hypothetical protein [Pedosphaera sp.]
MPSEIINIRVSVPKVIELEVMGRLNLLNGMITSIAAENDSRTLIGSTIPAQHVESFKTWLHKFSNGQGSILPEHQESQMFYEANGMTCY